MTFVTANNYGGNIDNNWLDSSTSQVDSISPQENIEVSDSDEKSGSDTPHLLNARLLGSGS
ncbi:28505_t:CDS:2, partial [Gigaspora margarita]